MDHGSIKRIKHDWVNYWGGVVCLKYDVRLSGTKSSHVAVPKSDGSVRVCGDYKVSANKAVTCDTHPIPRSEDIFTAMSGGGVISKLDLSHAYLQLQLDDKARDYLVINTHKGLFEYTRMPFGITSAPAIFL